MFFFSVSGKDGVRDRGLILAIEVDKSELDREAAKKDSIFAKSKLPREACEYMRAYQVVRSLTIESESSDR